jgi:hypothetical protein
LGMSTINKLGKTTIDLNDNKIIIKWFKYNEWIL